MSEENSHSLYHAVGGKPTLEKVHKIFYDILYAHPGSGNIFRACRKMSSNPNRLIS